MDSINFFSPHNKGTSAHTTRDPIAVAIIGAGPYGLSIAAHLRQYGIEFRIFGKPLITWEHMASGMCLKSAGFASNLSSPSYDFTLKQFCKSTGRCYDDEMMAIPLDTFLAYGRTFQQQFVPEVEPTIVTNLSRAGTKFSLTLDTGETVTAHAVIVATGLSGLAHVPEVFANLPCDLTSHTSQPHDFTRFRGRNIAVVGRGSSALDYAALLKANGAIVSIVARRSPIIGRPPEKHRRMWRRMRYPLSYLGYGWGLSFYSYAPNLFRTLPQPVRRDRVRVVLGPAGGWHLRDEMAGIATHVGTVEHAAAERGQVLLYIGDARVIRADHVVLGTGYQVGLSRLPFLELVRSQIRVHGDRETPILSANFESSVPGLYFAGILAANSFGPVMRFMCGADYAAGKLAACFREGKVP